MKALQSLSNGSLPLLAYYGASNGYTESKMWCGCASGKLSCALPLKMFPSNQVTESWAVSPCQSPEASTCLQLTDVVMETPVLRSAFSASKTQSLPSHDVTKGL